MNVSAVQLSAAEVPLESLAANRHLSEQQKISVASRQFEALLLKQILAETQKPVVQSEFTDNSTAAGIYQDMISSQLANSLSKSDAIGLARTFEQQLTHHGAAAPNNNLQGQTAVPDSTAKP
jgi:Rod binding domain-containing protein